MENPNTLLSKYYGVYQIKVGNMADINCFIMDNLLGSDFINIERIYDLKGSTKGRIVELSEEEQKNGTGLRVLKDQNYLNNKEKLLVPKIKREDLMMTIERDARFLSNNNLMDYSLLFIKAKNPKMRAETKLRKMPALVYVKQKDGVNQL